MSDTLFDEIEQFLADGGESDPRIGSDGKPVMGASFTAQEMRAMYGDAFMDDFFDQANEYLRDDKGILID